MDRVYQLARSWKGKKWHILAASKWNQGTTGHEGAEWVCGNYPDFHELVDAPAAEIQSVIGPKSWWRDSLFCRLCCGAVLNSDSRCRPRLRTWTSLEAQQNRVALAAYWMRAESGWMSRYVEEERGKTEREVQLLYELEKLAELGAG